MTIEHPSNHSYIDRVNGIGHFSTMKQYFMDNNNDLEINQLSSTLKAEKNKFLERGEHNNIEEIARLERLHEELDSLITQKIFAIGGYKVEKNEELEDKPTTETNKAA